MIIITKHLFVFSFFVYVRAWVITDVNYTAVIAKTVNGDEENEIINQDNTIQQERFNLIFPGTKWCGAGNIADSYDDLGVQAETDICCRDHDNCPEYIVAGETKYNLTNNSYYTRLSCKCDEKFRRCLRSVNNKTSNTIGSIYFNVLGSQCYRKDYKVVRCKKYGGLGNAKCIEYEYDVNSMKTYQWFDVPNF